MNSKTKLLELKKRTASLILEKLRTYTIWNTTDSTISFTARHHVAVRKWPLEKFCNPSNVASRIELEVLYNAWNTGTTYFEKLTREEMQEWERDRFSSRMELMGPPTSSVPAPSSPRTPATEMTLLSELPLQHRLSLTADHSPVPIQDIPLGTVTNLAPRSIPRPQAPDPDIIATMIRADPTLQHVDPTLIATSFPENNPRQAAATVVEQPPGHIASGPKRHWQEVVTPLSHDTRMAKKPRKQ